jgi:hypothetical protein
VTLSRRMFFLLLAPLAQLALRAQDDPEDAASLKVLTDVAAALSAGNPVEALRSFDKNMKDFSQVEASLNALTGQFFISSAIDFLSHEGDVFTVDWFLELRGKADSGPLVRRRQQVKVKISRIGNKPKVVSLEPVSLFAPVI